MYYKLLFGPFLLIIIFTLTRCMYFDNNEVETSFIRTGPYIYNLSRPDEKFELAEKLQEISGLDYLGYGVILCINDEDGDLFFYDIQNKEIIRKIDFGKSGDYEGIAHKDSMAWVIRSDGKLYAFLLGDYKKIEADKISLPFDKHNNIEGLCVYENHLLFACKDDPEINKNKVKGRTVYQYSIEKDKINDKPFIHLTTGSIKKIMKEHEINTSAHLPFKPSGIAIHPVTKDIFIIGSVGKLMIVCDPHGKVKEIAVLNWKTYRQPEGICFDEKGNLFISSEGRGGNGYILRINYNLMED